ncbi:hypothetical protein [Micromonospora sp. DT229]|uniref:hypothetical protein n=1 Tax=Micromonospora sp. DT229 TaxID=3393430 RepID=UPI003CE9CE8E
MKFQRATARLATAVVLLVGGIALPPATSASAATSAATSSAAAACDVHIGTTYKSGSQIVGYGSIEGCSSSSVAYVRIQKRTCIGCWDTVKSATVNGPGYDQYVYYNCSGTGTQTYRTIIEGSTIGGGYKFKESNQIRVSC